MPSAKIAARLPKGDRDGLNPVAEVIAAQPGERRTFIVVMHAATVEHDVEGDDDILKLAIDQIELVDRGADHVDAAMVREIMLRSQQRRNGRRILPFELRANLEDLFPNLITDDEREERENEEMSSVDRLRRHLERVHGYNGSRDDRPKAATLTDREAIDEHRRDHEDRRINHPTSFDGWMRSEIAELPPYLLAWSEAANAWTLFDRAGVRVNESTGVEIGAADVEHARKWAAEEFEALMGRTVIRWRNSDDVEGGWVPILDDATHPDGDPDGGEPAGQSSLLDELDAVQGGQDAPPDEATTTDSGQPGADLPLIDGVEVSEPVPGIVVIGGDTPADDRPLSGEAEPVPAAAFSHPEPEDGVDLDTDTRTKRGRRSK